MVKRKVKCPVVYSCGAGLNIFRPAAGFREKATFIPLTLSYQAKRAAAFDWPKKEYIPRPNRPLLSRHTPKHLKPWFYQSYCHRKEGILNAHFFPSQLLSSPHDTLNALAWMSPLIGLLLP